MNYADRVKDTSASVGTGPITLFGAPITGFRSFLSAFPSGAVDVPYAIDDGAGNWEIGIGSFADSVLTRTQVLSSSSNGGLVDFVAGKKSVICTLPADLVESATNRSIAAASESAGHAEQTAQDRAQTAIDKAATAEDRIATAADREQTGMDAAAASSAKTAAELAASSAEESASSADAARVLAEAASEIAQLYAGVFPDTSAETLAAVTEGKYFSVLSADPAEATSLYRKVGGAAVDTGKRLPSAAGVESRQGFIVTDAPNLNFDFVAGLLRISTGGNVRVVYGRSSFILNGGDIALPGAGAQLMVANSATKEFAFQSSAIAVPLGSVVVGVYYASTKAVFGLPPYYVNGALAGSYTPSLGFAFGASTGINFNTVTQRMVIAASTVRLFAATKSWLLPASDIAIPASSGNYRVEYSIATNAVSIVTTSTPVDADRVIFAFIEKSGATLNISNLPKYQIDGKDFAPKSVFTGSLTGAPEAINFDFAAGLLKIAANAVRVHYGNATKLLAAQDVSIPASGVWQRLVFSPGSGLISVKTTATYLTGDEIQIGAVNGGYKYVAGIDQHYVNGKPSGQGASDLKTAELVVVNGDTEADYVQPDLPAYSAFLATAVHTDIYALYDALVAAYPEYVSKTLLGNDTLGNGIYRYDFFPTEVPTVGQSGDTAKIILMSGVHGFEKAGIYNLYLAMHEICTRWKSDAHLEALRWNVKFIVVPMVSPYGFDNSIRKNERGVDIARNFPSGWVLSDPAETTYGGPAPLSELNTQYIDALLAANTDAIYCGSHHNFGASADLLWNAGATKFGCRLAKTLISRLSRAWRKNYAWIPQTENTFVGYSTITAPAGSEGLHATEKYGIQGGTFEINMAVPSAPDATDYSAYTATLGCEALINWLLLNLEFGAQLKNSGIRIAS